MKAGLSAVLAAGALAVFATAAFAYPPRPDVIWARVATGATITLDGKLDEPCWAQAETKTIQYRIPGGNGIPGSGYQEEGGTLATDTMKAVLKFLVIGNQLYMGCKVFDKSIGGSDQFNRFDGLLMNLRNHAAGTYPAPDAEYFYSWWHPENPALNAPGSLPGFRGFPWGSTDTIPRTPEMIANWDAATTVQGTSNTDSGAPDTSYTIEMRFNLGPMGYDVTKPAGDIVEWNISIYDCDWFWPLDPLHFSSNRTWWEGPWGNVGWYHEVRICSRPDVTINSGAVPVVPPEFIVPNASGFQSPTIDGALTEPVWGSAPSFDIRYGDDALRQTYPGVAQWRAGQFQPTVNGGLAAVLDPGDCTVRYFFKEDTLFLGFDVRDQVVQYHSLVDRWDGFIVSINGRDSLNRDRVLIPRRLSFQVGPDGKALAQDYLPYLRDSLHGAKVQIHLNPGTVLDTLGEVPDNGYQAELALDLTKLGYPHGRGDGLLFLGIDLLDGDSFQPITDSYGTRTWWFRQYEGENSSCWGYLDPTVGVTAVGPDPVQPAKLELVGTQPNPFRQVTTLHFSLPKAAHVGLDVYDLQGRVVMQRDLGRRAAGDQRYSFSAEGLNSGLYFYRLRLVDSQTGTSAGTLNGRMMLVR